VPALPAVATEAIVIALPADATLHPVPALPAVATLLLVSTARAVTRLSLVDTDATVTRLERVSRLNTGSRSSSDSLGRFTAGIIADPACRRAPMGFNTKQGSAASVSASDPALSSKSDTGLIQR
jgi:hypothetical protein